MRRRALELLQETVLVVLSCVCGIAPPFMIRAGLKRIRAVC